MKAKKKTFYKTKGAKPNKNPYGGGKDKNEKPIICQGQKMRFTQKRIIYLRFNKYTKEYLKYHLLN